MGFLTGKTALITGAGRAVLQDGSCGSIGYGIATAYAKEGANLVITGRNVKKLEEAKQELESKYGIKVLPVQADVCAGGDNEATVQNVVKQAVDAFGGIQVLINNAQASASGVSLAEHTTEQFDLALYSGLYAAFYYMKACYPYLKESHGSVINFASGAGLFGNYGQCAYAAAKEGIRGLSRVAATEWGPDDINVNVVCPLAWTAKLEQFQQAYPEPSRPTSKCRPWATTATPNWRSAACASSWPCRTSSSCPARPSRWRAAWVNARNFAFFFLLLNKQKRLCRWAQPLLSICCFWDQPRTAMHSISSFAPLGMAATCTQLRAGNGSAKALAYSAFTAAKSLMSARKITVLTTLAMVRPASARIALRFARLCAACSSTVSAILPVAGSTGI